MEKEKVLSTSETSSHIPKKPWGVYLANWFSSLWSQGFKPKLVFSNKDFVEVNAVKAVWGVDGTESKLCL